MGEPYAGLEGDIVPGKEVTDRYPGFFYCKEQACDWEETYYGWRCVNCGRFAEARFTRWLPFDLYDE